MSPEKVTTPLSDHEMISRINMKAGPSTEGFNDKLTAALNMLDLTESNNSFGKCLLSIGWMDSELFSYQHQDFFCYAR